MALTLTTLTSNMSATDLVLNVTSATGATIGKPVKVENEYIGQVTTINGLVIGVLVRGSNGGFAQAHNASSPVVFCSDPSDFPRFPTDIPYPNNNQDIVFVNADSALPVPSKDTIYVVTKGSAAALTLASPGKGIDGVRVTVVGLTDFAHVVTTAAASLDGTSAGSAVFTSAAFAGSSVTLLALKGVWVLLGGGTNAGPWVISG
jgi:hypothetical protein